MFTSTVAALALTFSAGTFGSSPPPRPADSIGVGNGMELLDTSFNQAGSVVDDPSLPGGRRATLRYLWWSVYVKATGNVEMRTALTCTATCDNPGNHNHGPQCTIGGCATPCPYEGHQTTLTATSSSSSSSAVSRALTQASSTVRSVTGSMGVSAGPFTAGVSATATQSSSSSTTLGASITTAVGRSVSGSTNITLGHFNTNPCTSETWFFGTKEYEVRMILQVFEQDYYSESWVIGGAHGVLPGSRLKTTGAARFVGAAQDVQLGTYQVPTNEPLSKVSDPSCGCRARATTTPNPYGDHSTLPSGTSKFYVTPREEEKVYFTNPTDEPIMVSYATFSVEVQPGEEKEMESGEFDEPVAIVFAKMDGTAFLRGVVIKPSPPRPNPDLVNPDLFNPDVFNPWASFENDVRASSKKKSNVEVSYKVEEGEKAAVPEVGDEVLAPKIPSGFSMLEIMIAAGMATSSIPVMNGKTPVLEIRGDIPDGATFTIESGDSQTAGDVFMKIKGVDGETKAAFVRFVGVDVDVILDKSTPNLTIGLGDGKHFSKHGIKLHQPGFITSISPESGPAGSSATLTIDTREILAYMARNTGAHAMQFDLVLNYGDSGGATGPERVPMDPSGITRVPVRRGSVPGGFQVAIGMDYRQNGGHELGHALGDSGGL